MAYDNNVPQETQTIAQTQPIILANFAYLQSSIGQEHNFDITDATQTYHLQASMPNQADPGALPASTDGLYYVNGGDPKYYNAANGAQYLHKSKVPFTVQSGTVNLNNATFQTVAIVPNNSTGTYSLLRSGESPTSRSAYGFFNAANSTMLILNPSGFDPDISIDSVGLVLRARLDAGASPSTFSYVVSYYTL